MVTKKKKKKKRKNKGTNNINVNNKINTNINKNRRRNIIWFNPLFGKLYNIDIGKYFLGLINIF